MKKQIKRHITRVSAYDLEGYLSGTIKILENIVNDYPNAEMEFCDDEYYGYYFDVFDFRKETDKEHKLRLSKQKSKNSKRKN